MPKGKANNTDKERVLFHGRIAGADAVTQVLVNLNPTNMSAAPAGLTRLPAVADNFAQYRIRKFKFRLHCTGASFPTCAGFVGGVQDTPPTSLAQIMELIPSTELGQGQLVPTNWVNVPPGDLAGPLPWYKTILGSADATEESPGVFVLIHTASQTYSVEFFIEYEFKAAVAPANTPAAVSLLAEVLAARRKAAHEAERKRLLRALSELPPAPLASASMAPVTTPGSPVVSPTGF